MPRKITALETVEEKIRLEIEAALTDLDSTEAKVAQLTAELNAAKAGSAKEAELTAKVAAAEKQANEQAAQIKLLSDAVAKAQAGAPIDITAIIKETAEKARQAVLTESAQERQALLQRIEAMEQNDRTQRLNDLRASLIEEANGAIIEALVRGETEEELKASAEIAKKEYAAVAAKTTQQTRSNVPPVVNTRRNDGTSQTTKTGLDGFQRSGDRAAFGKSREALLAETRKRSG